MLLNRQNWKVLTGLIITMPLRMERLICLGRIRNFLLLRDVKI